MLYRVLALSLWCSHLELDRSIKISKQIRTFGSPKSLDGWPSMKSIKIDFWLDGYGTRTQGSPRSLKQVLRDSSRTSIVSA